METIAVGCDILCSLDCNFNNKLIIYERYFYNDYDIHINVEHEIFLTYNHHQ